MRLDTCHDLWTGERTYKLTIERGDMLDARLRSADRLLLRECEGEDATIADKLLALELLARRIEEAQVSA